MHSESGLQGLGLALEDMESRLTTRFGFLMASTIVLYVAAIAALFKRYIH